MSNNKVKEVQSPEIVRTFEGDKKTYIMYIQVLYLYIGLPDSQSCVRHALVHTNFTSPTYILTSCNLASMH